MRSELPVSGQALDPTEVGCHVAQGVLVAAREHGVAKRSERRTSSIEIACPLEQHPVNPGGSDASEDRPPLVFRVFELEGALDERSWNSSPANGLKEGHVRQCACEHAGLLETLGELERRTRMSLGRRDVTGLVDAPCESPFDLDARRRIVSDLCESIAEQIGGDAEAMPEPADPSEAREREGALATRRKARHHFFEKKSRPVGVPRLEMALPGFDRPPPSVGVIGRREHSCPVPELRCGLRSATCSCTSGSILDGRGHLGIGTARSEGEMERLLVRIVDDLRQAGVQFASPSRRCLRVDDRGEQRM